MSEYQYYEFQTVDRALTRKQMDELRTYSTRARITPTSFINVYNWGDFKGDPDTWMAKYFDAFLYLSNWGSHWLMLRVPKRLLDPDTVSLYCTDETLDYRVKDNHLILSFNAEEVENYDWVDGKGWLASLLQLRSDLMHGDHRCLYLGWLIAVQHDMLDDDTVEPPLPPGLATLSTPLRRFAKFLNINLDLIASVAEKSGELPHYGLSPEDMAAWVLTLPERDKDHVLMSLLQGDNPHIAAELRQRALHDIRRTTILGSKSRGNKPRTTGQLLARAEEIAKDRRQQESERQEREQAERARIQAEERRRRLDSLAGKEDELWSKVDKLIQTRQQKQYDEAVVILQDLRDLFDRHGKSPEFIQRMSTLHRRHSRKPTLVKRFQEALLLDW